MCVRANVCTYVARSPCIASRHHNAGKLPSFSALCSSTLQQCNYDKAITASLYNFLLVITFRNFFQIFGRCGCGGGRGGGRGRGGRGGGRGGCGTSGLHGGWRKKKSKKMVRFGRFGRFAHFRIFSCVFDRFRSFVDVFGVL